MFACDICPIRYGLEDVDEDGKEIIRTCSKEENCTYWRQKKEALKSDIAVLTFAMLIANTYLSDDYKFSKRNLLIIDECHSLESQVAGMFAGFTLSPRVLPKLGSEEYREEMLKDLEKDLPKSKRIEDFLPFFNNFDDFAMRWIPYCENERERDKLKNLSRKIEYMLSEINEGRIWVIDMPDYKEGVKRILPRKFKPVLIDRFLQRKIWSQANKIILSTATVSYRYNISKWLKILGLKEYNYDFHSVPMIFPIENRPIITSCMGGKMTYNKEDENWEGNINIVKEIIKKHDGERGVIHTQSYERAKKLYLSLKEYNIFLHEKRKIDTDVIEEWFESDKMILISPAIKDGVDLKDDKCRFQILLKVPYPNIKDARVEYIINNKKDWEWYENETKKDIVQMYGRAVRSETDYAKFYIVDGSFRKLSKRGFPNWFLEALND